MVYDPQRVHILGIDEREWLTKIYEAEARRHPSQRNRWGTEQLAACFAFMNGATHLGGLDGNYDGAFIGSLNTSAAAGGVSNAMMLNAIKNDVVLTESDYRILKIKRIRFCTCCRKRMTMRPSTCCSVPLLYTDYGNTKSNMKMKREAGMKMLRNM